MTTITLLTQADCGLCEHAKTVLDAIGQEFAVTIEEVGLGSSQGQALAEGGWVVFAPGVLIDGRPFSFGRLSQRRLRRVLTNTTDLSLMKE